MKLPRRLLNLPISEPMGDPPRAAHDWDDGRSRRNRRTAFGDGNFRRAERQLAKEDSIKGRARQWILARGRLAGKELVRLVRATAARLGAPVTAGGTSPAPADSGGTKKLGNWDESLSDVLMSEGNPLDLRRENGTGPGAAIGTISPGPTARVLHDMLARPTTDPEPPLPIVGLLPDQAALKPGRALDEISAIGPEELHIRLIGQGPAAFAARRPDAAAENASPRARPGVRPGAVAAAAPAEIEAARKTALRQTAGSGAVAAQQRSAPASEVPVTAARAGAEGHKSAWPMIRPLRIDQASVSAGKSTA